MVGNTRREALTVAKAAVRAYSRNPSEANAAQVEEAWRAVRTIDAVAAWRQERPAETRPEA